MMQRFRISTFAMAVAGLVATLLVAPTARAQVVYQYDSGTFTELFNNSQGTETEDNFVGNLYTVIAGGESLLSIDLGVGRNVPANQPVSIAIYSFDGATYTRIHTTETTVTGAEGTIVNLPLDNPVNLNVGDSFLAAVLMRMVPGDWFPWLNDGSAPHGASYFDVGPQQGAPYDLDDLTNLTLLGATHPVVGAGVQSPGDLFLRVEATSSGVTCSPINQPGDAGYLTSTQKCDINRFFQMDTGVCANTDGSTAATFSPSVNVRRIGSGWATWGSPPDTEDANPPGVGFNGGGLTDLITLANSAAIAGLEVEPNTFDPTFLVTASFRDANGVEIASVVRDITGRSGARLFAVSCSGPAIASILVSAVPEAAGFALAQVRADTIVGAPSEGLVPNVELPELSPNATSNTQ